MKRTIILIGLAIMLCVSCNPSNTYIVDTYTQTNMPSLAIAISLDRTNYGMEDPILATVVLTNIGTEMLVVNARMAINSSYVLPQYREIGFNILEPSGQEALFAWNVNRPGPSASDFVQLEPGASLEATYDLQEQYILEEVGTYIVVAAYSNYSDPGNGHSPWMGRITSDEVTFSIEQ